MPRCYAIAKPRPIVERLNKEVLAATAADEAKARFERDGLERLTFAPGEFDAFIKEDVAPWARTLKALNIQVE